MGWKRYFLFRNQLKGDCVDMALDFVKNWKMISNKESYLPH